MSQLLGPNGKPISSAMFNRKAAPPELGNAFGAWAGRDIQYAQLPGGGIVQFDLSKLTLGDFRAMRDHYQVNASLAVLSFMQHQSDWHIECEDKRIASYCEEQLRNNWTQLNRTMATANWAGYSPAALDWENNLDSRSIDLTKIKDLIPEECSVNWKEEDGWAPPGRLPPKFKVYDGIKVLGSHWPIPVENSFWYPLLMENGDHYGRKLLRPAFTSWFFSILVHLFANRYYERFGEPVPIGRAPFDEEIDVAGTRKPGNQFLLEILQQLRSRSTVVLPNDMSPHGAGNTMEFDYDIEYLESQMRGADFERYLTRLDEEISIGLFTPILLLRTADVGSYNLGQGHERVYQVMLNSMNDDRALYINKYLLRKMVNYNFSEKAPTARIVFRKMGQANIETLKEVVLALVQQNKIKIDIEELGQMTGMTLEEIEETLAPAETPAAGEGDDNPPGSDEPPTEAKATAKEIVARVRGQVEKSFKDGNFGPETKINMGYKNKLERAFAAHGVNFPNSASNRVYNRMDAWIKDAVALGSDEFTSPDSFMSLFTRVLNNEIREVTR